MARRLSVFVCILILLVNAAHGASVAVNASGAPACTPPLGCGTPSATYTTLSAAWNAVRTQSGEHCIIIQDSSNYIETAALTVTASHIATGISIYACSGTTPSITLNSAANSRLFNITKTSAFTLRIRGSSNSSRIEMFSPWDNQVIGTSNSTDTLLDLRNVNITKTGSTPQGLIWRNISSGLNTLINVSFFGGSAADNSNPVMALGTSDVGASRVRFRMINVDTSGSNGGNLTGSGSSRLRIDNLAEIEALNCKFGFNSSNNGGAPALGCNFPAGASNFGASLIILRDCQFNTGLANLIDVAGNSAQTGQNLFQFYRPVFTGACGTTMFNIGDSKAQVEVLGLSDTDVFTGPMVDLDPVGASTQNIASLLSGRITLKRVKATMHTRRILCPSGILTANPIIQMDGCDWQGGTGNFISTTTGGPSLAPQFTATNTVWVTGAGSVVSANDSRTGAAGFTFTNCTLTGPALVMLDGRVGDVFLGEGSIFDGSATLTGTAPTFSLSGGTVPNVAIGPGGIGTGFVSVPSTTIVQLPQLSATGRLTSASAAALGRATSAAPTIDVDLDDRPKPASTTKDIGADEASFPPTDLTPNTMSVSQLAPNGTLVGVITSNDPDLGEPHTWTLVNNAGGRFAFGATTANTVDILVANSALLNPLASPQTIRVRVQDTEYPAYEEDIAITILDVIPPVITLNAPGITTVECGTAWVEPGATATDNVDSPFAATVGGDVVNTGPGTAGNVYTITYNAVDAAGNHATQVTRTVTVVDTTPPVLSLNGNAVDVAECGVPYVDPGANVSDNCDANIVISVGGDTVDTGPGTVGNVYTITYNAVDATGNHATQVTRTVTVQDTAAPIISLNGLANDTVQCGAGYVDPGASANDACDGAVAVVVGGDVLTVSTLPGVYTITYDAQDAQGNIAAQVVRTVTVDTNCPLQVFALGDTVVNRYTGDSHTFAVAVTGNIGTPQFQWYFDGGNGLVLLSGQNADTLDLTDLELDDSGTYYCEVSDDVTMVVSPIFSLNVEIGFPAAGLLGLAALAGLIAAAGARKLRRD